MKTKFNKDYFKKINYKEPKQMIMVLGLALIAILLVKFIIEVMMPLIFFGLIVYAFVWVMKRKKKDVNA